MSISKIKYFVRKFERCCELCNQNAEKARRVGEENENERITSILKIHLTGTALIAQRPSLGFCHKPSLTPVNSGRKVATGSLEKGAADPSTAHHGAVDTGNNIHRHERISLRKNAHQESTLGAAGNL
jgi:hypothetical protein